MPVSSALRRLAALHPDTEIWWDSSPLILDGWLEEQRRVWSGRPELLAALDEVRFDSLDGAIRGCTTNPPLSLEVIDRDRPGWLAWTQERALQADSPRELMWTLYEEIVRQGAVRVMPLYSASRGRYGHICAQVDPRDLHDTPAMVEQGIRLHGISPNVMIKLPATAEGIEGIRILSSQGISTNATLGFGVSQILATARAAGAGLAQARADGLDLSSTRSMATLMLGRMEDAPAFAEQAAGAGVPLTEQDRRWAGVAVARQAHRLLGEQAAETTLLLASMRLGPTLDDGAHIWHLAGLAGGRTILTIFPNILASFIESYAGRPLERQIDAPVPEAVMDRLLRVPYFRQAYEPHGAEPIEYDSLPGLQLTATAFAASMQSIEDFARTAWHDARSA